MTITIDPADSPRDSQITDGAAMTSFLRDWHSLNTEPAKDYTMSKADFLAHFGPSLSAEDLARLDASLPDGAALWPSAVGDAPANPADALITFHTLIPQLLDQPMNHQIKKPALAFSRADLPEVPDGYCGVCRVPANLFLLPTQIADRVGPNSCEENPALQQIIPYLVLINENDEILMYSRGAGGAESKLVSKLSIGFGGHVDAAPPDGTTLHSWIVSEARRELEEEADFVDDTAKIIFDGLIFDRSRATEDDGIRTYVGQVHVGLLSLIRCCTSKVFKFEHGVIEDAEWVPISRLREPEINQRLETWSAIAFTFLFPDGSNESNEN